MANKHDKKLGYFLLEVDCKIYEPLLLKSKFKSTNARFLIKWVNKLGIGDGNLSMLEKKKGGKDSRELVMSFKTIHENTYTVMVIDMKSA